MAPDKLVMADLVIHVLEFARYSAYDFYMGPFDEAQLLQNGLELRGDIDELMVTVRRAFDDRGLEYVDG